MSKVLNDSEVIIVYSKEEIEKAEKEETIVNTPCVCEEIKNDACYIDKDEEAKDNEENIETENKEETKEKININTATKEELETLNGIGEAKSKAIIEYREKNKFKSIDEILNVDGISNTIYEKIKEYIKV